MKSIPFLLVPVLAVPVLLSGSADLSVAQIWHALSTGGSEEDAAAFIVFELRLPQLLTALLAGMALAASGLVMQTVFGNPLADPSLLGVNAGAGLGAAVAMLLLGGSFAAGGLALSGYMLTVLAACLGAVAVIVLLIFFSSMFRSNLHLLVAGVMVSFVASSLISILGYYSTAQGLQGYVFWGMGDFGSVVAERLWILFVVVFIGVAWLFLRVKTLNALLLGRNYAANLGVNVRRERTVLLLVSGLLCAVVTALCGPIAFIGLAAPHFARFVHRTANHRTLLPLTLLWGMNTALVATLLTHLPGGVLLPLNAVTPLLGVPVVLYLLLRRQREA